MLDGVLKRALKQVEPDMKEAAHVDSVAVHALELVKQASTKFDGVVGVIFGGSYAKGTWLKNDVDVDIFVKLKTELPEKEFERTGRKLGFQALRSYKPYLRYSQHPYVEAVVDGVRVDVVPCYNVERGRWISAADRSPYHTEFIKNSFDDEKRRQARLLKKFMKGVGVYGAEMASAGFSGYVCEVMILKYGSFTDVLKAAAEFGENQVISTAEVSQDIVKMFDSSLIIPDPVDQRRNLGTAISGESAGRFILASRRFLERPELRYFAGSKPKPKMQKLADNMVLVRFKHGKRSQDIIWGQLKSSMNAIAKQLGINGFNVVRAACGTEGTNSAIVFLLESLRLPNLLVKQGPAVFSTSNSNRFIAKNKDAGLLWVGGDARVMALVDNKFTDAVTFLRHLLRKKIETSGVSRGLMQEMQRSVEIYTGRRLLKAEGYVREVLNGVAGTDEFAFGAGRRAG